VRIAAQTSDQSQGSPSDDRGVLIESPAAFVDGLTVEYLGTPTPSMAALIRLSHCDGSE
jgi:hypothetical protein